MSFNTLYQIPIFTYIMRLITRLYTWVRWNYLRQLKLQTTQATEATLEDLRDEDIMYKSEHFVVVNKRYDVRINSEDPDVKVSVATQLAQKFPDIVDHSVAFGFRFVHRLDFATSGALCIALTKRGAQWGGKAFSKRYVSKYYLALVRGHMKPVDFSRRNISIPLGRDRSQEDVYIMCTPSNPYCEKPRSAITTVVLLEHGKYDGEPVSKIMLIPRTGRSHQLRVHLAEIGHPIVGDYTYSGLKDTRPYRMMLHAYRLVVPMKYEQIDVICPDPFTKSVDPLWSGLATNESVITETDSSERNEDTFLSTNELLRSTNASLIPNTDSSESNPLIRTIESLRSKNESVTTNTDPLGSGLAEYPDFIKAPPYNSRNKNVQSPGQKHFCKLGQNINLKPGQDCVQILDSNQDHRFFNQNMNQNQSVSDVINNRVVPKLECKLENTGYVPNLVNKQNVSKHNCKLVNNENVVFQTVENYIKEYGLRDDDYTVNKGKHKCVNSRIEYKHQLKGNKSDTKMTNEDKISGCFENTLMDITLDMLNDVKRNNIKS